MEQGPSPLEEVDGWSGTRKKLTLAMAFFSEATLCLVVSGWPAFLPVLVGEKAYFEYCSMYALLTTSHAQIPPKLTLMALKIS